MIKLFLSYYSTCQTDIDGFGRTSPRTTWQSQKSFLCKWTTVLLPMEERGKETDCESCSAWWLPCYLEYVSFYPIKSENWDSTHKSLSSKVSCCKVQRKQIEVTSAFSEVWFYNVHCAFRAPVNTVGIMELNVHRRQGKNLISATKHKNCNIRKNEVSSYCIW